jgi:hypothetical protein
MIARLGLLFILAWSLCSGRTLDAAEAPRWLPRYELKIDLDLTGHQAHVVQQMTWTNHHQRPAQEIVLNIHSSYAPPKGSVEHLMLAKMLEGMRIPASQGMYFEPAFTLKSVEIQGRNGNKTAEKPIRAEFQNAPKTAYMIELSEPVKTNESITFQIEFDLELPQRQGRWGQWKGITFLTNWNPVLAYYDDEGWHPTPFIPWHQPFFNEAGEYTVEVRLPVNQHIACTGTQKEISSDGQCKVVRIGPVKARDFALLCSDRYHLFTEQCGNVEIRVLACAHHEFYAKEIIKIASHAIQNFTKWFGPFPYPQMTYAESYFGWNGNECSDLVMVDERIFDAPHIMTGYVEYLITHETCHQWWYNILGNDGYRETFMDEAFATYFAHRLLNQSKGKNNPFINFPEKLSWLPNINREDYRNSGFYGTVKRNELMPAVGPMEQYGHVGNLFSAVYDRGSKVLGILEDRMGEAAFLDFIRQIYQNYFFRIIKVDDFQRELQRYTGQDWTEFFNEWLRGVGLTDWSIASVAVDYDPQNGPLEKLRVKPGPRVPKVEVNNTHEVSVLLQQKGALTEATVLGVSFAEDQSIDLRFRIDPRNVLSKSDPNCIIEPVDQTTLRVRLQLPQQPSQIVVDPDETLPDADPTNNAWKSRTRVRVTPFYSMLDETPLTARYDRGNLTVGPWVFGTAYADPWFTRSTIFGGRVGYYETERFSAGVYAGYRPDFGDVAAGFDATWYNVVPKIDVGIHGEKSLFDVTTSPTNVDRFVAYSRYVITRTSSFYTLPTHYVEAFTSWQHHFLPTPRESAAGSKTINTLSQLGLHYHADFLTPYWDPELGFKFDLTGGAGLPVLGQDESTQALSAQLSWAMQPNEQFGWLHYTKFAFRLHGSWAWPKDVNLFALGGNLLYRGFDIQERQGSRMLIGSAEWRIPILREQELDVADHVVGLRNFSVAPFYDVGWIAGNGKQIGQTAHAVGIGLRADVAWFSFLERTSLRLDFAKTINAATPLQMWFGIQHPF